MMGKHARYLNLAEQILQVGQLFVSRGNTRVQTVRFGSKNVQIISKQQDGTEIIDPIKGLISSQNLFADYSIVFMDGKGTGFFPDLSGFERHDSPLGQVRSHFTAPFRVALDVHTDTTQIHDPRSGVVVIWCPDIERYPYWAAATPFRLAFSWLADTFDSEMLHGAAIARDNVCLVLAGKSGAGKSTFAFLSTLIGFQIISDDYFLFEEGKIFPVYTRGKLHDASLRLLSGNRLNVVNPKAANQKRIIDLDKSVISNFSLGMQPSGYLVPQRESGSSLEPTTSGEVFRNLAPYSASGLLGGVERSFLRTKRAIGEVPSFRISLKRSQSELLSNLEVVYGKFAQE